METVRSSETLVNIYQSRRRHIREENTLHSHRQEIVKSHIQTERCILYAVLQNFETSLFAVYEEYLLSHLTNSSSK
jgi:hypothetical protein